MGEMAMINYFDDAELAKNHMKRVQNLEHPKISYIYKYELGKSTPIRVIKEIAFEDVQLYRALQYENNPNIINIIDVARIGERTIVEMEYLRGRTIGSFIDYTYRSKQKISTQLCLKIMLQICSAMQTCHKIGFVHRDISANNILLTTEGKEVKVHLIDFENRHWIKPESCKDTTTLGTEGYAAPEQWGFSASDPSTDIYAAGILFCQMLTGRGREAVEQIQDANLRYIVKRCIRLEKDERYRDVHVLISDLRREYQIYVPDDDKSISQIWKEDYDIDYANLFLQSPEPIQTSFYAIMVSTLIICTVLSCIGFGIPLICCIPFSMILSWYYKKRLDKTKFYYPYNQSFVELQENLYMNLIKSGIKFKDVDDCHMTIRIKKRTYYVTADVPNQALYVKSDWGDKIPGVGKLIHAMEDYGVIVYLFQHIHTL